MWQQVLSRSVTQVSESVEIHADPRQVYDAVSDVRRMGEWSPEATGAKVDTSLPIRAGDRFRGTNRKGLIRWSTECTVIEAAPGEVFSFEVRVLGAPMARWRYRFSPLEGNRTRVTESWSDQRTGPIGFVARTVGGLVLGAPDRAERNRETMRVTLDNLKSALEAARST